MRPDFKWGFRVFTLLNESGWAEELNALWRAIGWQERTPKQWRTCLEKSDHIVSLWLDNRIVGIGRIVTDGVFATFYDIAIHPTLQRQGYGKTLMAMLIERVKDQDLAGIHLFRWDGAGSDNQIFYKQLGFEEAAEAMALTRYMKPE